MGAIASLRADVADITTIAPIRLSTTAAHSTIHHGGSEMKAAIGYLGLVFVLILLVMVTYIANAAVTIQGFGPTFAGF